MSPEIAKKHDISDAAGKIANSIASQPARLKRPIDCAVPSKQSVVDIVQRLKAILFPGYQASDKICPNEVQSCIYDRLVELQPLIETQIRLSLVRQETNENNSTRTSIFDGQVDEAASDFLQRLPNIRERLLTDVVAAYDGDPACKNVDEVILCYPGLTAVIVYRLANELYRMGIPFLPRIMSEWAHGETGIDIHPGATIGSHFFIDHGTGVVIGETCEIGNNVKIYQGVTLGALSFDKDERGELVRGTKRHPTLEDNVIIYANATVLGGKTIVGKDSIIGSSVWVTRSISPGTTVTMKTPSLRIKNQGPEPEGQADYHI